MTICAEKRQVGNASLMIFSYRVKRFRVVHFNQTFASSAICFLEVETTGFAYKSAMLFLCGLLGSFYQIPIPLSVAMHAGQYATLWSFISLIVFQC